MSENQRRTFELEKFKEWCDENGIKAPLAELRYCGPEAGYGFFAKTVIRNNEAVVEIPKKMMLTAGLIAEMTDYSSLLEENFGEVKLEPFEVLVLFFYLETLKPDSSWKPYLDVLPRKFSTPLFSTPDLDLTAIPLDPRTQIEKQKSEIKAIKEKFKPFVKDLDDNHFLWSWHVVNTRCIYCENQPHPLVDSTNGDNLTVIPLMDMMNHDPNFQCNPGFDKHTQSYRVTTSKAVPEEEQLYVCYGSHDNAKLWTEYGFRIPGNIFNRVIISIDLLLALASKTGFKIDKKNEAVVREANFPCTLYGSDDVISYGIKKSCMILHMSRAQLKDWQRIVYDEEESETIEEKADQLGLRILEELASKYHARSTVCNPELRWLWDDQLEVINSVISSVSE
ncbi:hypothetical protein FO519_001047 [Halicephalobus sp. NKZ332]|nr:hypothetical protein FO519_001047 [Halicephalobus sp. NKZ332]